MNGVEAPDLEGAWTHRPASFKESVVGLLLRKLKLIVVERAPRESKSWSIYDKMQRYGQEDHQEPGGEEFAERLWAALHCMLSSVNEVNLPRHSAV